MRTNTYLRTHPEIAGGVETAGTRCPDEGGRAGAAAMAETRVRGGGAGGGIEAGGGGGRL